MTIDLLAVIDEKDPWNMEDLLLSKVRVHNIDLWRFIVTDRNDATVIDISFLDSIISIKRFTMKTTFKIVKTDKRGEVMQTKLKLLQLD